MMTSIPRIRKALAVIACAFAGIVSTPVFAFDADTAEATARQSGCFKCHSIDKKKDGPAYRQVAAKYKGKSDAEQRLITHLTTGPIVEFRDGHEEEHKVIKTKDADEVKNVVLWILSL
jgi:cytochrome c